MKQIYTSKTILFLLSLILLCLHTFAQSNSDYQKKVNAELAKFDLAQIRTGVLLNQSIFGAEEFEFYKKLRPGQKSTPTNSEEWLSLYDRLRKAQLAKPENEFPDLMQLIESEGSRNSKTNIIPIGIFDIEGTLLTEQQLKENERKKSIGQPVNVNAYEKIHFISASVLQEKLFQAEVNFKISSSLYVSNSQLVKGLEIDFGDGKGFKHYELKDQLILHTFAFVGQHTLKIRLQTSRGAYLFETSVNVLQLERRKPFREFQITAEPIVHDTAMYKTSSVLRTTNIPGASIRVILGCDQVYDKPIIVAEGIDLGENFHLDDLEARYLNVINSALLSYISEGYDVVLVDWSNSKDFIQNNAQVLKAVINDANQTKVGNHPAIVIGESMGGLVARWALREMETQATPHQVSHFICYDTPHQGANVPIGLTQIYWETPLDVLENLLLSYVPKFLANYYRSLTSPAARQMLIHWGGQLNIGVGNTHPDYFTFRSALTAMGNGGYPATCRNVAMLEGSLSSGDRSLFDEYAYGDRIVLGWLPGFRRSTQFDVHTNALNDDKQILRLFITQIPPKFPTFVIKTINYNHELNDDFLPGGRSSVKGRILKFLTSQTFDFCFVPTFSSIDYSGSLITQAERELLNVNTVLPAQTPFAAIYGRANNQNGFHIQPWLLPWRNLGLTEGILTNTPCPAAPNPPVPSVYFDQNLCFPFSQTRQDQSFPVTVNVTATGQQYRQTLLIERLGSQETQEGYLMSGQTSFTFYVYEAGQYRVTCERSYPGRPDLTATAYATVNVSNCPVLTILPTIGENNVFNPIDCQGFWEGDYLLSFQDDTTKHAFVHKYNGILYATLEKDKAFVPKSVLIANNMFEDYAECFAQSDPRPLPVVLTEFNAKAREKTAVLSWITTSEINSERFDIERSGNGKNWQKIGSITAKNGGTENTDYSYTDRNPGGNLVYYRLKMVDVDSSFAYSRIQPVGFSSSETVVYPNPIEGNKPLQLLLSDGRVDKIFIYDLSGKEVYQANGPADHINTKNLMVGRYILKIKLRDGTESSHVIIRR